MDLDGRWGLPLGVRPIRLDILLLMTRWVLTNSIPRNYRYQERGDGFLGRDFDSVGTSSEFPFLDGFGWLEARFELETGRSSCGGREPAKGTGNDDRTDAANGEVVVFLEVAVPKGAPRAWIGLLGYPDEDWGL